MKSKTCMLLVLFFVAVSAFSQEDCPERAENEKFINNFIKKEQLAKDSLNKNQTNERKTQTDEINPTEYEETESDEYESWGLHWKEYHNYYFSRYLSNTDDKTIECERDLGYTSQEECFETVARLHEDVHTTPDFSLQIQIIEDCHPYGRTKDKYTYEKGEWIKKKTEPNDQTIEGNSSNSPLELLRENISSIPCGYVIKEINKENDKYNLVIEAMPGEKSAQEDSQKRKELDEFYSQLKVLLEANNQKKEINVSDQKRENNLKEFAKDEGSSEETYSQNSSDSDNKESQESIGGPNEDYKFNLEKDIAKLGGQHLDIDENGITDQVIIIDDNGIPHTYVDENEDGRVEYVSIKNPDNSAILVMDSDSDGRYDSMTIIDKNGDPEYHSFDEELYSNQNVEKSDEISYSSDIIDIDLPNTYKSDQEIKLGKINKRNIEFEYYLQNQPVKEGSAGYISPVTPTNGLEEYFDEKTSNWLIVGIGNTSQSAVTNGLEIANATSDIINVVSSDFQLDNSENGLISSPDALTALTMAGGDVSIASEALANNIIKEVQSGKQVRLWGHSRGAIEVYNATRIAQNHFNQRGMGDLMENVEIVTLGGFSPPANEWPTNATVVDIVNDGDIVPALMGKGNAANMVYDAYYNTCYSHPLSAYLTWVEYINLNGINEVVRNQSKVLAPPP
ncbi:MAG: MSCRAMM family adhesin SdrC [Bacteroidales bacterium]|nr:MSCRAMM family adhesin SdrC [Bacteroidales bacterium]